MCVEFLNGQTTGIKKEERKERKNTQQWEKEIGQK
jgi:hypothetical protein